MDAALLEVVGKAAGIGGVSLGVFLLLFRNLIRKLVFPQLTREQAFHIIKMMMWFIFLIAFLGIVSWLAGQYISRSIPSASVPPSPSHVRGSALIYDGFRPNAYNKSGFQFSAQSIVGWDSRSADVLASTNEGEGLTDLFIPYDAKDYKNPDLDSGARSGIREMPEVNLDSVSRCPSDGYEYHWHKSRIGAIYCVRWRDGIGYSAIRIHTLDNDRIGFDYINIDPSSGRASR